VLHLYSQINPCTRANFISNCRTRIYLGVHCAHITAISKYFINKKKQIFQKTVKLGSIIFLKKKKRWATGVQRDQAPAFLRYYLPLVPASSQDFGPQQLFRLNPIK